MQKKIKQNGQVIILMIDDVDADFALLKRSNPNIIATKELPDIISHITTTRFKLILIDLSLSSLDFISRITDPGCINHKTPVIALINPAKDRHNNISIPTLFTGKIIKPVTEQQIDTLVNLWQTKPSALNYIQMILDKTKNNQRLALTIFEKLFEELPVQILGIKDAIESRQYALAQTITHKLNGSASFCGLTAIQKAANALENSLTNISITELEWHLLILQQHILNLTNRQRAIIAYLVKKLLP